MCLVLDSLILEYADNINLKVCIDQIRPLGESLQLPLAIPKHENIKEIIGSPETRVFILVALARVNMSHWFNIMTRLASFYRK